MKLRFSNQRSQGLTLVEVLVVVAVMAVFFAMIDFGAPPNSKRKAQRINCVNNLKEIGLAYQLWANGHDGKYPMQVSVTNGGTMGLDEGRNTWINFLVMSNELNTPRILVCTADDNHSYATNFRSGFSSANVSYFVGLDADTNHPQRVLSGDDNFEIGGIPIKSGLLKLSRNVPIAWTATRHIKVGNIGLADGSVQQVTISRLQTALQETGLATNRLAIP